MSLLGAGLIGRELRHDRRFEAATANPGASQARMLQSLVRRNAGTAFGREHGFAAVRAPADFARLVPVRDYEGFRPYVDRIEGGEPHVLTTDPVTMFTTTSGTTGAPKLVPVTARWEAQMAALLRLWMLRAVRDHPRCFDQQLLLVVSPAVEGRTPTGFAHGAMSGLASRSVPRIARRRYAIPSALLPLLHEHEERYFLLLRLAVAQAVSAVATPNPTTLLRLADVAAERSDDIIRAIRDGSLGVPASSFPEDLTSRAGLARLVAGLRPDPARARVLEGIVGRHGTLSPAACWPGLDLIGCWLGGTAGIHATRLREHFGPAATRDLGFLASEGRFTIPVEDGTSAGPLAVHAGYYEFVPEGEMVAESPTVLGVADLRDGERYHVLVTGGNGLYRYDINDLVEVRGFHRRTPKVAFIRKGRDVTDITGEKLHLNHVQSALQDAERRSGLRIWQSQLIPDVEGCRYDLLIERDGPGDGAVGGTALLRGFDQRLSDENIEYRSRRRSQRLGPPRLHLMRSGWSEGVCRRDFRAGRRESQYKWPLLCDTWDDLSRSAVLATLELPRERRCA